jgi:hypothetical protein
MLLPVVGLLAYRPGSGPCEKIHNSFARMKKRASCLGTRPTRTRMAEKSFESKTDAEHQIEHISPVQDQKSIAAG